MRKFFIELELKRKGIKSFPFYKSFKIEDSSKKSAISRAIYSTNEDIYDIKVYSVTEI